MPKDVLITPASALVEFKNTSSVTEGTIKLTDTGFLEITSSNSGVLLGDAASDVYIGDGVTSTNLIFEQSGGIYALAGKTITLGNTNSSIAFASNITGNLAVDTNTLFVDSIANEVGIGTSTPSANLHVIGNVLVSSNVNASYFVGDGSALTNLPASSTVFGFQNSTTATIPSGDLGTGETEPSELNNLDEFLVQDVTQYDLMEPRGRSATSDLNA